jgi:NAD(P)-dependent dehydrogenase (short-subunit alcohol dehydrogenase family)
MPLANLKIFLTGASRGIGAALAETLARAGAGVAIVARDEAKLAEVASLIKSQGGVAIPLAADVAHQVEVTAAVSRAEEQLGGIDILINAAGIQAPIGPFAENDLADWEHAFQVNLMGPVRTMHAVLPIMRAQRCGKIINFSGGGATGPRPHFSAYAAAKAALVRLTETLALELNPFNIQINAVAPGAVNTQMLDEVIAAGEQAGEEYHQALERARTGGTPLALICELVLFLASPASGCLTGKLISAPHDPWREWQDQVEELNSTPLYTIRRLDPFTIRPLLRFLE